MKPRFRNAQWDERRLELQEELGTLAEKLVDHMSSDGEIHGAVEFTATDGRSITVVIEAGERPKGH